MPCICKVTIVPYFYSLSCPNLENPAHFSKIFLEISLLSNPNLENPAHFSKMSHFTAYAHPISQRRYKDIIIWLCYSYSSFFNFCQYWQNVPVKLYYLMSPFFQAVAALAFRHFTEVYQEHYLFSFSLSIMATKLPYFQMFSPFKRGDINAIIQFNLRYI